MINQPGSPIAKYYPEKFELEPFDNVKEYQWIPLIEQINSDLINKELDKIPRSALTEKERDRNLRNKTLLYEFDPNSPRIKIESILEEFKDVSCNLKITPLKLDAQYPFDFNKMSCSIDGYKQGALPSFHNVPNVEGVLKMFGKRNKYERVCIFIGSDPNERGNNMKAVKQSFVYYNYPHKNFGNINLAVTPFKALNYGSQPSKTFRRIEDSCRQSNAAKQVYGKCLDNLTDKYYSDMALIFENRLTCGNVYEIEKPMKNIRLCNNKISYSYKNVDMLLPDVLLSQQPNTKGSLINANQGSFQVYKKGALAIDLQNGDIVQVMNPIIAQDNIDIRLVDKNFMGCDRQKNFEELATTDWEKVNEDFLIDVNLRPEEAYI